MESMKDMNVRKAGDIAPLASLHALYVLHGKDSFPKNALS